MSYSDVAAMVEDWDLRLRLMACAAQEHPEHTGKFMEINIWRICGAAGWDKAWAKVANAIANDPDYRPGADQGVITDAMIKAGIRAVIAAAADHVSTQSRVAEDGVASQQKAEHDAAFDLYVRQREWELAHLPQYTTPTPPLLPTEPPE